MVLVDVKSPPWWWAVTAFVLLGLLERTLIAAIGLTGYILLAGVLFLVVWLVTALTTRPVLVLTERYLLVLAWWGPRVLPLGRTVVERRGSIATCRWATASSRRGVESIRFSAREKFLAELERRSAQATAAGAERGPIPICAYGRTSYREVWIGLLTFGLAVAGTLWLRVPLMSVSLIVPVALGWGTEPVGIRGLLLDGDHLWEFGPKTLRPLPLSDLVRVRPGRLGGYRILSSVGYIDLRGYLGQGTLIRALNDRLRHGSGVA